MPALVGADLQKVWLGHPVKAGPMKIRKRMMQFTGDRRHDRDRIGFALNQGLDMMDRVLIM